MMKKDYENRIHLLRLTLINISRVLIIAEDEGRLDNISYKDLEDISTSLTKAISNELKYGMDIPKLELVDD